MSKSSVCLLSGGLDSAVAAAYARAGNERLHALFVDYGQKTAARERGCAERFSAHLGCESFVSVDLRGFAAVAPSGLSDPSVLLTRHNREQAYVPFRNTFLIAVALAFAETTGSGSVYLGSHGSDRVCPDNSPDFYDAVARLIPLAGLRSGEIAVKAPFLGMQKSEVVRAGVRLGAPLELTWSCYNRNDFPCMECLNCLDRAEAFLGADLPDPLHLAAGSATRD